MAARKGCLRLRHLIGLLYVFDSIGRILLVNFILDANRALWNSFFSVVFCNSNWRVGLIGRCSILVGVNKRMDTLAPHCRKHTPCFLLCSRCDSVGAARKS